MSRKRKSDEAAMEEDRTESSLGFGLRPDDPLLRGARRVSTSEMMGYLATELHEGMEHGFFQITVTCEVVKGGRRRVRIAAGVVHQFIVEDPSWVTG